jgi:hypothetical protein
MSIRSIGFTLLAGPYSSGISIVGAFSNSLIFFIKRGYLD